MKKSQVLETVERVRQGHIFKMGKIKLVIEGKESEEAVPLSKMECEMGQWLYDEKSKLPELLGLQFYSEIDRVHETWHLEYAKIYKIFFSKKKEQGLLSKLFSPKKIDPLEIDKAKLYYAELQETTKNLLILLDKSQRRLSALNESKFS